MKKFKENKIAGNIIIITCTLILIYLIISIYFIKHFNFGTVINGVNVSGKNIDKASEKIESGIKKYKLELKERGGISEEILGDDISLKHNLGTKIKSIKENQNSLIWIVGLISKSDYKVKDLILYDKELLKARFLELSCISSESIVEPSSAKFEYIDEGYITIGEVYGNKINIDSLYKNIENAVSFGEVSLDLEKINVYENPKYTITSKEIIDAKITLDKYNSAEIIYIFDEDEEIIDGPIIKDWININEELDVVIDEERVRNYIATLSTKYNTVGKTRNFKTAYGKEVEVPGGYYGWRINTTGETNALIENVENGEIITKEPLYLQSAIDRGENDIGDTYVEISINRQYLWFHKDGEIIAEGDIVTGDINRGFKTSVGTYMLTYKQKGATLEGENYSSEVKYWMPFNGNIGIHDASWRYSFGGNIYKQNGTHGCVNAPEYLAKKIFENIEDGIPIICYSE